VARAALPRRLIAGYVITVVYARVRLDGILELPVLRMAATMAA
jgi:hypothetical protein